MHPPPRIEKGWVPDPHGTFQSPPRGTVSSFPRGCTLKQPYSTATLRQMRRRAGSDSNHAVTRTPHPLATTPRVTGLSPSLAGTSNH
eukprot:393968-Amorphochlora_amoeboformis.AAC.1